MVKTRIVYKCPLCKEEYETEEYAIDCLKECAADLSVIEVEKIEYL